MEGKIYGLHSDIEFNGDKRILINTGNDQNLIQHARRDPKVHAMYKRLLENDYILYYHDKNHISKFYKRKYVQELFKRKDLIRVNDVFYTLDKPIGRKVNELVPRRLLVLLTCMPPKEKYDSHLMPDRMFLKFFDGIEKNLVKNIYTMRIMDLNVSHGSHYISTVNYPEYESDIQKAILKVINDLSIDKENVVLYGVSKGGSGAIYHGSYLDLKTLAVDPILNIGGENEQNDRRFLKGLRKEDLVPTINENLSKSNKFNKYIICSEYVPSYYEHVMRIDEGKIKKINMIDNMITSHPEVSRNSVPEQLMILNMLFSGINKM